MQGVSIGKSTILEFDQVLLVNLLFAIHLLLLSLTLGNVYIEARKMSAELGLAIFAAVDLGLK